MALTLISILEFAYLVKKSRVALELSIFIAIVRRMIRYFDTFTNFVTAISPQASRKGFYILG
jgi:hypothetical protein